MSGPWHGGKGDRMRPFDQKKWDKGYERIFGDKEMTMSGNATTMPGFEQPEFQGFPRIPRLNREIIITEKIDGTNAQILITEDGRVYAGSRKRWLTLDNDNYGFAAWVQEHREELLQLGPGRHFGEWWGQGIQRNYGLDHKRFSLFNIQRWYTEGNCEYVDLNEKSQPPPPCCRAVPILGEFPRLDSYFIKGILEELRNKGSFAAPGFNNPEGIIIYHIASNHLYKITLENDDKPKGTNQ